jgi:hypothetical protein
MSSAIGRAALCAKTSCGVAATLTVLMAALARPALGDDGSAARDLVQTLGADEAHAALLADPLGHAREALERAARLRESGDEARAKAADGLAVEWAETARDLVRAADAEREAERLRHAATAKVAQVERARALVEADLAHVGRLRKEIADAAGPGTPRRADGDRTAIEVHDGQPAAGGGAAGGKKKAAKKAPAPAADVGDKP